MVPSRASTAQSEGQVSVCSSARAVGPPPVVVKVRTCRNAACSQDVPHRVFASPEPELPRKVEAADAGESGEIVERDVLAEVGVDMRADVAERGSAQRAWKANPRRARRVLRRAGGTSFSKSGACWIAPVGFHAVSTFTGSSPCCSDGDAGRGRAGRRKSNAPKSHPSRASAASEEGAEASR